MTTVVAPSMLTSPSPVIQRAVLHNDADAMRRLQHRVQNHGDAPPPSTSSPAAPSFVQPPAPAANGYSMAPMYQANGTYPAYQQPQAPPRTPRLPCTGSPDHDAERDIGPTYFFKDSPFFEIRELVLSNISLEGLPALHFTTSPVTNYYSLAESPAEHYTDSYTYRSCSCSTERRQIITTSPLFRS